MSRVLIVDDEPQILRMLRASLQSSGYEVVSAGNGLEGFTTFETTRPDLIITDMSMPVMDGFGLTQEIRRISDVPIIVLSVRSGEPAKVTALDAGADDYVTKPFNMPELLARVRVQLRRAAAQVPEQPRRLAAGDFVVDTAARDVLVRGESVHLSPKEFDLLILLLKNDERVLTHRIISKAVWGPGADVQSDNLRVLVAQLRRKVESSGHRYIHSEPWVGYRLSASGDMAHL